MPSGEGIVFTTVFLPNGRSNKKDSNAIGNKASEGVNILMIFKNIGLICFIAIIAVHTKQISIHIVTITLSELLKRYTTQLITENNGKNVSIAVSDFLMIFSFVTNEPITQKTETTVNITAQTV